MAPGRAGRRPVRVPCRRGKASAGRRQPENAAATLAEALALWRGPSLADFAYDSFAQNEIGRLDELRLGAVETRLEADLALGRHADVAAELQALVAEHRFRERFRGQLMLALVRSGRKPEALRVYEEARPRWPRNWGSSRARLAAPPAGVLKHDPALADAARVARAIQTAHGRAPPPPMIGRHLNVARPRRRRSCSRQPRRRVLRGDAGSNSAGIVAVPPNSLAAIDPKTNDGWSPRFPSAPSRERALRHGALWVANLDDDTSSGSTRRQSGSSGRSRPARPGGLVGSRSGVGDRRRAGVVLRIDPEFNEVVARIPTVEAGSLLTAARRGRRCRGDAHGRLGRQRRLLLRLPSLSRINPATNQVAGTVTTGNGPTAVAVGFGDSGYRQLREHGFAGRSYGRGRHRADSGRPRRDAVAVGKARSGSSTASTTRSSGSIPRRTR